MEKEGDTDFAIHVAVVDDAITVTMPGTRYSITYRKGAEPWLLASDSYDDRDFPSRLLIRARLAAFSEIGWRTRPMRIGGMPIGDVVHGRSVCLVLGALWRRTRSR